VPYGGTEVARGLQAGAGLVHRREMQRLVQGINVGMTRCPVCANEEKLALTERYDRFSIYSCPACEVQFAHPLSYSTNLYDELYSSGGLGLTRVRLSTHSSMVAKSHRMIGGPQYLALQWLKQNIPTPSPVLEVGFGGGWFLAALEHQGYIAMGIEVAKEPVELLKQRGFTVAQAPVNGLPPDWAAPRAVILFEVLEHLPDPVGFLRTVHENFPNAPLILSTPSPKRWCLRLGHREHHDYPPYHLIRWTERSLSLALRKAGYADAICEYPRIDPAEFYSTLLGFILARLHLLNMGSPDLALKDSHGQLLVSKAVEKSPGFWLRLHDAGLAVFRVLLTPVAWYFNRRGWSSASMLAIGLPLGWHKDAASA